MNSSSFYSIPFQRLCVKSHSSSKIHVGNPVLFLLSIFIQHRLEISFNDGEQVSGILTSVDSDFIEIDGHRYRLDACSFWLERCQVGVVIDASPDEALVRMVPCKSYGVDHREFIFANLGVRQFSELNLFVSDAGDEANLWDYPVLYAIDHGVNIYGTGVPIPKVHFGRIERYTQSLGAGQIVPQEDDAQLRVAAEDLLNVPPNGLDTFSFCYDVSYTIGFLRDHTKKATNVYKLREVPLRSDADPLQVLDSCMKDASRQWNVSSEIVDLEPLPGDDRHYGLLIYYLPTFQYIKLYRFYKSKIYYGELTSEERKTAQLTSIPQMGSVFSPQETINTKDNVYLVSYGSEFQLEVHAVYEKKDVWMLRMEGNRLLIVYAPWKERPKEEIAQAEPEPPEEEKTPFEQEDEEETPFIISLPALESEEACYAFLNYYNRNSSILYLSSVYAPGLTKLQARQCTLAKMEPQNVQFIHEEDHPPVEPDAALNTYKSIYVVRITPEEPITDSDVPFVKGPVTIVKSLQRKSYRRLKLKDNLIQAYGASSLGITQSGSLPQELDFPEYVQGETLLVLDENGQHTVTFDAGTFHPDSHDSVYRFGILTDLFRQPDGYALSGGRLSHRVYFDIADMGEQIKNIIQTSPKRILLQYTCANGKIVVDRVIPESVWDIPWRKGTVTKCTNSVAELTVTVDDEVVHYQSTETDGYVNSAARNGSLRNESVFMKQIVCPDWQDGDSPQLLKIATHLHCEREKAIILYHDQQDQYYACRYNFMTNVIGTVRRIVYGSERALAAAVNQHEDIVFQPYGNGGLELIPLLPPAEGSKPDDMRMPSDTSQKAGGVSFKPGGKSNIRAEITSMGRFMLQVTSKNSRYHDLLLDIKQAARQDITQDSQAFSALAGIFYSERWDDLLIAANLLKELPSFSRQLASAFPSRPIPLNTHALLRRALRARVKELVVSGNYQTGEFIAFMQPILDSDTSSEQRARDLYVYFQPSFSKRYNLKESVLFNITKPSFVSETDFREQEFVKQLRDLFGNCSPEIDASCLLAQVLALDESSFDYLFDMVQDTISKEIREKLLAVCGVNAGAQNIEYLLSALREKRLMYSTRKARCLHSLNEMVHPDRGKTVADAVTESRQEMFDEFLPLLDKDDQNNLREFLRNCQSVASSARKNCAVKMRQLEKAATDIGMQKVRVVEHPTLMMIELFQNTGLLERVHEEIIQTINELCRDDSSLPDVRCVCNYPILVHSQSNFALILKNGSEGSQAHRAIRDPVVHLTSKGGINADNIVHELRPKENELHSGGKTALVAGIELSDVDVGTIVCIGYTVTYQYLDSVQFDVTHNYVNSSWKDGVARGDLTLHVEEIPDSLRNSAQVVNNPYKDILNRALDDADSSMYFGRQSEQRDLLGYLCDKQKRLISGRIVLVYGQKQCGKTSFINRIRRELKSDPQAIILYYSDIYERICQGVADDLAAFMRSFYADLLEKLVASLRDNRGAPLLALTERYDAQLRSWSEDLLEGHLSEKTDLFFKLLDDLRKLDQGQHKIVLIIDEFTRLCNAIIDCRLSHPEYRTIPEFIRSFSNLGFIQIIVGHDSMMQTLTELNVINRTAQTAKIMQLSALDVAASEEMIRNPMQDIFGFNVYQTDSGKAAVCRLQDLSGRNPNYLAYLCDKMFEYYQSAGKPQMDEDDVGSMLDKFAVAELKTEYKSLFDPLLAEDFDSPQMRDDIYAYLCDIAKLTCDGETHECAMNTVSEKLGPQKSYTVQKMLIARNVLSADRGMIRINVGLFREHVRRLYGK